MSFAVPPGEPRAVAPPVVPGYTLEGLLGRGASGEVWRAVPRRGGAPVAVKVLVAGDPERQAREAALLGELDHPHLVRLIEVVHQPRRGGAARVALVLELLGGGSLTALLGRRGRLRPGEVVTAIAPVAAALAHAHGNGVVHGDLSPGNIVFTAEGRPVLTDLGVARVLGETAVGEVTPAYVDPTVARGGAPGPASDVFGVAAAAFHALTGIPPWNAAGPADTLGVAADGFIPDLAELAPEAPPELVTVIRRGLAPDPHDRGSAAAFALDLRHACRPEPVQLLPAGADLGVRAPDLRTELTHQVPGRRPRPAPAIVEPAGRREVFQEWFGSSVRPVLPRLAVGALVVGGLVFATWVGVRSTGAGERAAEPQASEVAASAELPEAPAVLPDVVAPAEPALADRPEDPATVQEWGTLVGELYERRARVFGTASAPELDDVYTAGSAVRAADERHARELAETGELLLGFAPTVVAVTGVTVSGDVAELDLVDRWPAYEVVAAGGPDGAPLRTVPGRPDAGVRMVLARTADGWRIESAERR
ncbi:serine/threonine protein kinase [Blastococcus sp. CT_GayMR20]|uniref:serine/threonine-protein kinase n=1 Tax=Blastococcus sp. CT_GayMR20 TaxID=2559609 RepID=UPI001073E2BF|nr:serine/threonine-protein kinase [Blastococcus sp. CT_GayMR20]TFV92087.1 serine/threonine protein kinase [Blastococcus sp. CT_GayMR20]